LHTGFRSIADFGGYENFTSPSGERFAHQFFIAALVVQIGGVETVDTVVLRLMQHSLCTVFIRA
jgi:hypothetical protein